MATATKGNGTPKEPNDGEGTGEENENEPKYVKVEDIGNIVNAAVKSQLSRTLKTELDGIVGKITESFNTKFAEITKPKEGEPGDKAKPSPEVASLQQQLAELKEQNQKNALAAANAEKARREESAFGQVRSAFSKLKPEFVDVALDVVRARGLISFDDEGKPLFKVRAAPAAGLAEEDQLLPLADGVARFLKSKEAALFLPAPTTPKKDAAPVRVNGARQPMNGKREEPKTDTDKLQAAAEMEAEILANIAAGSPSGL